MSTAVLRLGTLAHLARANVLGDVDVDVLTHHGKLSPTVKAWFMARIFSEDDPWSPNWTTFHSNWPSYNQKLVFHLSEPRTRSYGSSTARRVMALRPWKS